MLLRHSLFYALARGLPGLVGFLTLAVYTRLLPPDAYGHYALVIAAVGLGNALLFEWARLGLLRFLPGQGAQPERLLATLLGGCLGLVAAILVVGGLGVVLFAPPRLWSLLALALVLLAAHGWFELNLALAQSRLTPARYGLMAAVRAVLGLILGSALILAGLGAGGPVLGLALAMMFASSAFAGGAWRGVRPWLRERVALPGLLAYGLPLTGSFALNFMIKSADRFLIAWLIGSEAAGHYAAGYDLAWAAVGTLMLSINLAGYPLAIRAFEQGGETAARDQLRQNVLLLLVVGLPAALGLVLLAPNIVRVMLGAPFREAATALVPWIAVTTLIASLRFHYLDLAFHLGKRTLRQMAIMAIAGLTNLLLNLWWIPLFGMLGAAYATLVTYVLAFGLAWWLGRGSFPLPAPPPAQLLRISVAVAGMGLALWPLRALDGPAQLLLQVATGIVVYAACLLALDVAGSRGRLRAILATAHRALRRPASS